MKLFLLFLLLIPLITLSQSARFTEIKVKPLPEKYNVDSATIIYPIIILANKTAAEKINQFIKKSIADDYTGDSSLSIDSFLRQAAENGLTGISYEPVFNKNGILSLSMRLEGVAAYPTWWQKTMNFDLITGNSITLKEFFIGEKFAAFRKMVSRDKIKALTGYKKELKKSFDKKEIEKEDYEWALREINEYCLNSISFEKFILTEAEITILDECEFPHVILALSPAYNLKYKLSKLKLSLKQKAFKQLTQ